MQGALIDGVEYGFVVSVDELNETIPKEIALYQNYPNPFNLSTNIRFKVNNPNNISIIVYDAMGQEIKRLFDNEFFYSGTHELIWNGKNNSNQTVTSGAYYCRLLNGFTSITRIMILIK